MSKERDALQSIFETTELEWEDNEPYENDIFDGDDERFDILFKALKRNETIKIKNIGTAYIYPLGGYVKSGDCPKCYVSLYKTTSLHYCGNCGQALDWGDDN